MGLDLVELVMAVEEEFGVEIPDHEAGEIATPRELVEYVIVKTGGAKSDYCRSQAAFYLLRRSMMKLLPVKRNNIKPNSLILEFGTRKEWGDIWNALGTSMEVYPAKWPGLSRPTLLEVSIFLLSIIITVLYYAILNITPLMVLGSFTLFCFSLFTLLKLTKDKAILLPRKIGSIKDIVPLVQTSARLTWEKTAVYDVMEEMVITHLGLKEKEFFWDGRFIEDFGAD